MRCINPRCERGGFEIDREILNMTLSNANAAEILIHCPGDEGTPKDRKTGDSCENILHLRLRIKCKK